MAFYALELFDFQSIFKGLDRPTVDGSMTAINGNFSDLNADRREHRDIGHASKQSARASTIWFGTVAFWVVVLGLITARIVFLDVSKVPSATTLSTATAQTSAGEKLSQLR